MASSWANASWTSLSVASSKRASTDQLILKTLSMTSAPMDSTGRNSCQYTVLAV
jgi:hypothetical protein